MNAIYKTEEFESMVRDIHISIDIFREELSASLIGVKYTNNDVQPYEFESIRSSKDVYQLLTSKMAMKKIKSGEYDLIALLTAGWAAPKDNIDVPPSEHPDRKRVKMTLVGNTAIQYGSVLTIDGQGEDMYDYMTATGQLADSFQDLMTEWRPND
jgi:hypothetical protein